MTTETIDHAIEILSATNDGDDLDPRHLKLLECAVNGLLTDHGKIQPCSPRFAPAIATLD